MNLEYFSNFLDYTPISLIIIVALLFPIIKGLILGFSASSIKKETEALEVDITFIVAVLLGLYYGKSMFSKYEQGVFNIIDKLFPKSVSEFLDGKPKVTYIVLLIIFITIIYQVIMFILKIINRNILYPVLDVIGESIKNRSFFFKRFLGAILNIPKGICYAVIISVLFNIISIINVSDKFNEYVNKSKVYNIINEEVIFPVSNSSFAKELPNILDNSLSIDIVKDGKLLPIPSFDTNEIIYFNGTTLEEGIKSNDEMDDFSIELASKYTNSLEKSKAFYNWISKNIEYDKEKANALSKDKYKVKSGAIEAYETRTGVCFDYSCLFTAFCIENNIMVRIVTGEGYSGVKWVNHAWNQVYIEEEKRWINVDTTFGKAGNYFDSESFSIDHRGDKIVGQW